MTDLARDMDKVARALIEGCGKDDHRIANNILANVCFNASSPRRNFTKAATAQEVRASLNKPIGKRGRAIFRYKHALAIKSLKGQGKKADWESVKKEAEIILKKRLKSRGFLRAGWVKQAGILKQAAKGGSGLATAGRSRQSTGRVKVGVNPKAGSLRKATKNRPTSEATNRTPSISSGRSIPDYQAAVFSRGNPAAFKAIGEQGLAKAFRKQLEFEKRTLPRALETCARRSANKGARIAAAGRKLL